MIQEYDKYTDEDHEVWAILYSKQNSQTTKLASQAFLNGIEHCEFRDDKVPNFNKINANLKKLTGWQIYVVPGLIDNKPFFEHLSKKQFPATTWLRTKQQLEYLEEPDMFHDVFGHIPLLSEAFFCRFLEGLSNIALKYINNERAIELVARIYWYTVEFGLILENTEVKIYGAGILSSSEESLESIKQKRKHKQFDVEVILQTPYIKDKLQEQYFVINSYQDLYDSLPQIEKLIYSKIEDSYAHI